MPSCVEHKHNKAKRKETNFNIEYCDSKPLHHPNGLMPVFVRVSSKVKMLMKKELVLRFYFGGLKLNETAPLFRTA